MILDGGSISDHVVLFDCFKRREHRSHCDHPAAERRAEIVFLDMPRNLVVNKTRTDWNAAAERFGDRYNIRFDAAGVFASRKEPISSSANAGLHFIKNE